MTNFPIILQRAVFILLFSCLSVFPSISLLAQDAQLNINGSVLDQEGVPLTGVQIILHELNTGTISDVNGKFTMQNIPVGSYHLHATMVGYKSFTKDIKLINTNLTLEIVLNESLMELHEVVVEGDLLKLNQKESSIVVSALSENDLKKYQGSTLINSLSKIEGVNSINLGVGVSKPVIRGMSSNRVVVADQGIKQEGQQWGADHGVEIDQYNIESVEILKGPASLMYGSDAMGGVMRIGIPNFLHDDHLNGQLRAGYTSNNEGINVNGRIQGRVKKVHFRVNTSSLNYGDYRVPAESYTYLGYKLPIEQGRLKNTAGKELHLNAMLGIKENWGHTVLTVSNFDQQMGVFPGATGIPRSYDLVLGNTRDIELPAQSVQHLKVVSNSNIRLGDKWLEIDAAYQRNLRKEYERPAAHGIPIDAEDSLGVGLNLQTVSLNAKLFATHFKKFEGVIGFQSSFQDNQQWGFDFIIPAYQGLQFGVFLVEKYHYSDQLTFNAGIRTDMGVLKSNATYQPFYHDGKYLTDIRRTPQIDKTFYNFSGSVGLAYNPTEQSGIKVNFGKTFRMPTIPELTSKGAHHGTFRFEQGDSTLTSEHGYQLDIAHEIETGKTHISSALFSNYIQDFIYLSPENSFPKEEIDGKLYPYPTTGQLYQYRQHNAIFAGGEVNIHYHPIEQISLGAGSEYVYAHNLETDFPLPQIPPFRVLLHAGYEWEKVGNKLQNAYINLDGTISSAQNRVERNELTTPAYQILDLALGTDIGAHLNVYFQIQNLTDQHYYHHLSRYRTINLPEPGRNFIVGLIYKFGDKS